ncbi:hypothetical protein AaE_002651 [Aphanomyces astaci]|uniref:Reverse transcriptase zinc-binding domain-containing protein n=1 Tax=Aphanomyces astaci TaxID=112090 RepID=A0A6A5AT14_APHAT|nr:hypothetical protein AaE_002651 [Aphanomyces astaci]
MVSMADFRRKLNAIPTESNLANFLRGHRVTSYRVSARQLVEKLPQPSTWAVASASSLPRNFRASTLRWSFALIPGQDHISASSIKNKHLLALVTKNSSPEIPWLRLALVEPPPTNAWLFELKMDKVLLPVFADFKYRLQHNALSFGYKQQWNIQRHSQCPFGCDSLETAQHLLWLCPIAKATWEFFLEFFVSLVQGPITWDQLVFGSFMTPAPEAPPEFHEEIKTFFHITRSVVLRTLWLHRNDLVFGHLPQPSLYRLKTISAHYIKTHLLSHFGLSWTQGHFADLLEPIFSLATTPSPSDDMVPN